MEKTYIVTKALWNGQEFTPVGQRFDAEGKNPGEIQNLVARGFIAEQAQVEQAANPQAFDYKQQLAQAQARVAELEGQLASGEEGKEVSGLLESNHALKAELDKAQKAVEGFGQQLQTLKEQLKGTQAERDAARKALAEGNAIPEDALERLIAVQGIGEKLAKSALEALTAPAQAAE